MREIRLRALADAPAAFGSTLLQEKKRPWGFWRDRATPTAERQMWSARVGDDWVALVGAIREGDGRVQLVSMWVDPEWRGLGVSRALISSAVGWSRGVPGPGLFLWVSSGNEPAIRRYLAEGFQFTGARLPLVSDPTRDRLEMCLAEPG